MTQSRFVKLGTLATIAGLAASAGAAEPLVPVLVDSCDAHACEARDEVTRQLVAGVESALFNMLPVEQRAQIAAGLAREQLEQADAEQGDIEFPATDENYAKVAHVISREKFDEIRPIHRKVLVTLAERAERRDMPVAACFAPGSDPELAMALSDLLYNQAQRFQQTGRWSTTALSGGGLGQGQPTTITYGYVPDGTFVPDLIGGASGNSQLFVWLNGIYGNAATWQALFDQVFDRWEELSGNTYVYEPNDDGVNLNGLPGVAGVRADCRIAAIGIDGGGGILAYNNFPDDGDMVLDAFDGFYNSTGNNSLRLRNIIAHEHGHGKGMLHVCPANETKLMEPFISTAYDGPQLDDILNAQRHYGDPLENNDSPGQATPLGALSILPQSVTGVSIDDNSDADYYSFTIGDASEVTANIMPTGAEYTQGPQTQSCNGGSNYNSQTVVDLRVQIIDANGITVLDSADDNGAGQSETASAILENPGTYFVRVDGANTNSIQAYSLAVFGQELPFLPLSISLVDPIPQSVDSGGTFDLTININPRDEAVNPGDVLLFFRNDGGAFSSSVLTPLGGNDYMATVPASLCDSDPEFYFQVTGDLSGALTLPEDGAADPFSTIVGDITVAFADDFQSDMGWSVSGDANGAGEGEWERAVPSGDGSRGDAPDDFDGSGFCYVTGDGGPGSNTDVDGGTTILTSPAFDVSGNDEATLSYARWYNNVAGASPNADVFVVEISNNNGASWTNLETVGPAGEGTAGGWFQVTHRIADFVAPTSQVRVRFTAEDAGSGSVVEAAVDAIEVTGLVCEDPKMMGCNGADLAEPFDVLNFDDVVAFLGAFGSMDPAADLAAPIGVFDFSDVVEFLSQFGAGCP